MLLHDAAGPGRRRRSGSSWRQLQASNPVSRGLLLPDGEARAAGERARARWASSPPGWRPTPRPRSGCAPCSRPTSPPSSPAATPTACFLNGLDVPGQLAGREPVNQSLYLWSKAMLPSYVLTVLGDRMEMAHSVEGRLPFLDHHVVELARDLPVVAEDPGHDGEVRAARGGPPGADGHRLRPAQAPVPDARPRPCRPASGCTSWCRRRCAARPWRRCRSTTGRRSSHCWTACRRWTTAARTAYDPVLMVLLSACHLQQRFKL